MKVFVAHSDGDQELAASVVTLLREDGHEVFVAAEAVTTGNLLSEISAAIRSADVLIAVLTGSNPNVYYELGLATGAGVSTLITGRTGEPLPADLATVPYVQLTGDVVRDAKTIARRTNDLQALSLSKVPRFSSAEEALRAANMEPSLLESLPPLEFERLVGEYFRERGFAVSTTTPTSDAGVDLVLKSPKDERVVLVEVKKLSRQSRVSVEAVRGLLGAVSMAGATLGMLVSTSGYTATALALAAGTPVLLRTLDDILAAKSTRELVGQEGTGGYQRHATDGADERR
jgi:Holliday junction resolvase